MQETLYSQQPNILTPALALPLRSEPHKRFSEHSKPVMFKELVEMNATQKLKAHPLRHTFLMHGGTDLVSEGESPANFVGHMNKVCF